MYVALSQFCFFFTLLPEKREKFDNGQDPLDPEQENGGGWHGGHGFHFNPFQGGGRGFKFHFGGGNSFHDEF